MTTQIWLKAKTLLTDRALMSLPVFCVHMHSDMVFHRTLSLCFETTDITNKLKISGLASLMPA